MAEPAPNAAFLATLPEPVRGHEALKDVGDVATLATRFVERATPKPLAEMLPKEIAGEAMFKDIKSVEDLARGFHGQSKLLGLPKERLLRLPESAEDKVGWGEVYQRLGRPDAPEKYALAPPKDHVWTEDEKAFHQLLFPALHEAGLSQKGVDGIYAAFTKAAEAVTARENKRLADGLAEAERTLRADPEIGGAFEAKAALSAKALQHYASVFKLGDGLEKEIRLIDPKARPALFKLFAKLGEQLQEDKVFGHDAPGGQRALSPKEAEQQINARMQSADFVKRWRSPDKAVREAAALELAPFYDAIAGGAATT